MMQPSLGKQMGLIQRMRGSNDRRGPEGAAPVMRSHYFLTSILIALMAASVPSSSAWPAGYPLMLRK